MIVFNKKHKILISASIFLNIVLISIVVMSIMQINNIIERTIKTNVIDNLFELYEITSLQKNDNESDLALLSKQLQDISLGTIHALNISETSNTLNKADSELLLKSSNYLFRYSTISESNLSEETVKEMQSDILRFNAILTENGFDNEVKFGNWTKENYF